MVLAVLRLREKRILVKYEHVYLYSYDSIADLRAGLKTYFSFFNQDRPHQGLARQTPDEVYFADRLGKAA